MRSTQHLHSAVGDIPTDEFEAALDADHQPTPSGLESSDPEPPSNPRRSIEAPAGPFASPNGRRLAHRSTGAVFTSPPNLLPMTPANGGLSGSLEVNPSKPGYLASGSLPGNIPW